ncbi:hypothetical protein C8A03DRAFT_18912 [Achaetomium macrosporum]|uniref:Uncharacterized protein n=1 Tax=Achaetomium macrosporum TaxID=79813 RepID=A0AAN7C441_9PEZI|nr:hypothetical protein C8A03DRAFT_18912 [Achaetomium macrosporum]
MANGSSLLVLPDAVLGRICSQFCPHCAGEDCLGGFELPERFWGPEYFGTQDTLAKVNVRVGRLAQQVRLHIFCGRRHSLTRLIRTLLDAPALAEHLRVVRLGHRDGDQKFLGELTPENVERLKGLGVMDAAAADRLVRSEILRRGQGRDVALAKFKALPPTEDTFFILHCLDPLGYYFDKESCPGNVPYAVELIPVARLNAFLLSKLAKKITAVAILSEWPFAVFPPVKPAPRIRVKGAKPQPPTDTADPGRLPQVVELRLDSSSPDTRSGIYRVDLGKTVGLLARVPNLRTLRLRGVDAFLRPGLSENQLALCRSTLANLTTLDLASIGRDALHDIIRCCSPAHLRHVTFKIPPGRDGTERPGSDSQGSRLIDLLAQFHLAATLTTLHIETSHNTLFGAPSHVVARDEGFETIETLRDFVSLCHLSISADNIYFPSLFERVLLRDEHTDNYNHRDGERLVNLLPPNLESLEITGIYAIHARDMLGCASPSDPPFHFPNLTRVLLRAGGTPNRRNHNPWPFPGLDPDDEDEDATLIDSRQLWQDLAEVDPREGARHNERVAARFAAAGVEYGFDGPEFYVDEYAGTYKEDPREL